MKRLQDPTPGAPKMVVRGVEGSPKQGRRAVELECPRSHRVVGCKARGRKQGYKAKVKTKRKTPRSVPQRSLVSLNETIPTNKG